MQKPVNPGNNIMNETSPIIWVYFMAHCAVTSQESSMLETTNYQISDEGKPMIYHRIFRGRGCSFQEPFIASELGFELFEYDLELTEHWVNQLFIELRANAPIIAKWRNLKSVRSTFTINMNIKNDDQRPVFFLSPEQLELLAGFGAAIFFDGYIMFEPFASPS